jgi:hypothetical protein
MHVPRAPGQVTVTDPTTHLVNSQNITEARIPTASREKNLAHGRAR